MELNTTGFQKSEIVVMAEQLYSYKAKKKALELELISEEFHQKYVPRRQKLLQEENSSRLLWIIPLLIAAGVSIYTVFMAIFKWDYVDSKGSSALLLMVALLFLCFGGYALVRLLIAYIHNQLRLANTKMNPVAKWLCDFFHIDNIKADASMNNDSIFMLRQKIEELTAKISFMERQYNEFLEQIKAGELWATAPEQETPKVEGKFSLRADARGSLDLRELYDVYCREEQLRQEDVRQFENEISRIDRKRAEINDEYENAKHFIIICVVTFLVLAVIQDVAIQEQDGLMSAVLFIVGIVFFLWLEKRSTNAFLDYWIEHDSPVVKNYMFYNSIIPLYAKRELLAEQKEFAEKELQEVVLKKMALETNNEEFS